MKNLRVGWAMCGSFCTFGRVLPVVRALCDAGALVQPIFSEFAYETDTRFGAAAHWVESMEDISGRKAIHSIIEAEPIGPKSLFDILIVAPVTGNTLAKLSHGITDSVVSMACKSHLRGGKPLLLAISTNDGLSGSAPNIGTLMNRKHIYFVPYRQDDANGKPASLVADMESIPSLLPAILEGRQPQPVFAE